MAPNQIPANYFKALALCAALLLSTLAARAQSYSIDWYTIDGGGGTSTNGNYSVTGTIGQPDAGTMSGGAFSLTGGFWSVIAVQTPGAPTLSIKVTGNNAVLSWADTGLSFRLQNATNITTSTLWTGVSSVLATNSGIITTTQAVSTNRFFRLIQQ